MSPVTRHSLAAALLAVAGHSSLARAEGESGVSPSRLSLPAGPGSLEGVGENVSPNINMGLASYNVPLDIPAGQRGLQPELALSYGSAGGASIVGMGWSFGLPSIERMTSEGLPRYDQYDKIAAGGGDELVRISGTDTYRNRYESGFVRYRWIDTATAKGRDGYWTAEYPDGRVAFFGARPDGSVRADARVSGPDGTFRWHISAMTDLFGHRVEYEYDKDGALSHIRRVAYAFDDKNHPRYVIAFRYAARSDELVDCKPGFETRITKRLAEISVLSSDVVRRSYRLDYQTEAQAGALTKLAAIYQYGLGGVGPYPIGFTFDYSDKWVPDCAGDACRRPTLHTLGPLGIDFRTGTADLVDMNGDGLPDVLDTTAGHHQIFVNEITPSGTQRLRAPVASAVAGSGSATMGAPNVQMVDLDGDGFTDLIDGANGIVYWNRGTGDWASAEPLEASLPDFASDVDLRFTDWDGDKAIDVLHSDPSATWVVPNRGDGTYDVPVFTDDALGLGFTADGVQLSDMNGDGLPDVVRVLDAAVAYRPGLGYGRFGAWHEMFGFPAVMPAQASFVDIDGDSLADAVVVLGNEVRYAPNRSGTYFGTLVSITPGPDLDLPERTSDTSVRFADMNGNGSTDVVWIDASGKLTFLELEPIRKNLLTRVRNGIGKVIELSYTSSVLEMARDGGPDAWLRRLPQAHTVLKTLSHYDAVHVVREEQTFDYHDGYHDGREQQFRGFEHVDAVTSGDSSIELGSTRHTFDVGLTDPYFHGKELRTETTSGGRMLHVVDNRFDDCPVAGVPDDLEPPVRSICQIATDTELREGRPSSEWVKLREESIYAGFGNDTRKAALGVVTLGGHGCAPCAAATGADAGLSSGACGEQCLGDESYSDSVFITPVEKPDGALVGPWLLRNVASTRESARPDGDVAAETRTYYDGADFAGLPLGQVTRGLVSRRERKLSAERWADSEKNRFDVHGNVLEQQDAEGHRRRFGYDPLGLFVIDERVVFDQRPDPYELSMTLALDPVQDRVVASSDWTLIEGGQAKSAGASRRYGFDAFGRLAWMSEPGDKVVDPANDPTTTYSYELGDPVSRIVVKRRSSGGPADIESILCIDGTGRMYQKRTREGSGRWAVSDYRLFDSRGAPQREYEPWISDSRECDQVAPGQAAYRTYLRDGMKRELSASFQSPDLGGARLAEKNEHRPLTLMEWDVEDTKADGPHADTPKLTVKDGLGRIVHVAMLAKDRSALWSVDLAYDALGKLARVTDGAGHVRRQTYDLAGRLVQTDDPDAGTTRYTYDDADRLVAQTDARGVTMRFAYDEAERLVAQWDDAAPDATRITHHYDRETGCEGVCTHVVGRRAFVEYPLDPAARLGTRGRDVNGFDAAGYPVRSRIELGAQTYDFELEPDRLGRVVRARYPGGVVLEFQYDAAGRVTRVPGYIDDVDYTARGTVDEVRFANGTVTDYHEDALGRIDRLATHAPDGLALQDDEVVRDAVGNVLEVRDLVAREGQASGNAQYQFDDRYRLVSAAFDSDRPALAERVDFAYDSIDNLVNMASTRADSPAQVGALSYGDGSNGGPHAVVRAGDMTYDYDAAGLVTRRGEDAYAWDFMGRLTSVARGAEQRQRVVYGEGTQRIAKVEGRRVSLFLGNDFEIRSGIATAYVSIGGHHAVQIERAGAAAEVLGDLAPLAPPATGSDSAEIYAQPDGVVTAADAMVAARIDDGDLSVADAPAYADPDEMLAGAAKAALIGTRERVTWLHDDVVGSVVLTTDANGNEVTRNQYYPYGESRAASRGYEPDYSFADKERDDTGLVYFGARYLDSRVGRWVSPDMQYGILLASNAQAPEALDRYMYALDNPVTSKDADGNASSNNFNRNGNSAGLSAGNIQANYSHMLGFAWRIRTRERGTAVAVKIDIRLPKQRDPDKPIPAPKPPDPKPPVQFSGDTKMEYYKNKPWPGGGGKGVIEALGKALDKAGPDGPRVVDIVGRVNTSYDKSGAPIKDFKCKECADQLQLHRDLGDVAKTLENRLKAGDTAPITFRLHGEDQAAEGLQGTRITLNQDSGLATHGLKEMTLSATPENIAAIKQMSIEAFDKHNQMSSEAQAATGGKY